MACDDELLITYGLGYVFEKSKLLIISEIEEKKILKHELNIMEEISNVNKLSEIFKIKCSLKFPTDYILSLEEALEEKLLKTIPMITSIRTKNMDKQVHLMEEYTKRDLNQLRLIKKGYIPKDSNLIKQYLDNCAENLEIGIKDKRYLKYNKMILRIILTSSFGNEFGLFLIKQGQAIGRGNDKKFIEEQFQDNIKSNCLIKKKYNELDFLNLILFLEEWEKKYFSWNQKYTSLMYSIDKKGNKYKGETLELKDSVISFIKEKRYLYFPFGRYNEENVFITLDNDRYMKRSNKEYDTNLYNKNSRTTLEKKEKNLYEIILRNYEEIDLEDSKEIGYLLLYNMDEVYISLATYDEKNEKIECVDKYEKFNEKMIEILEKHFII